MAISAIVEMFVQKDDEGSGYSIYLRLPHRIAYGIDLVIGPALLVIGLLALCNIISMSPIVSYALIGSGATYAILRLVQGVADCKNKFTDCFLCETKDTSVAF